VEPNLPNAKQKNLWPWLYVMSLLGALSGATCVQGAGILQLHQGYFWDPTTAEYFIPRGLAYQTWNPPVGASQSFEQLDYDLV